MKKIIFFCFLFNIAFFSLISCRNENNNQKDKIRIITDMAGRKVEIPEHIQSAFIDRHSVMMIYALDTLLPVNRVFNYNESEKRYLKKGFYENKPLVISESPEEIIRLDPDVVLLSKLITPNDIQKADELQKKIKKPVILLDNHFLNYKSTLSFLGRILEKEDKAEELIDFIRTYVDPIPVNAGKIPLQERKTVYYAEGYKGLQTDPSGSLHSLLIDITGGINVAKVDILPGRGMTGVSLEQIYSWNPDIILVWSGNFDTMDSYKHVRKDHLWKDLDAVKENKVYQVPWKPFGWIDRPPGLNRLIGSIWLSNLVYPDIFKYDMNSVTKEFFIKFYHYQMGEDEVNELINPQPPL